MGHIDTGSSSNKPPVVSLVNVGDELARFAVVDFAPDAYGCTIYNPSRDVEPTPKLNKRGEQMRGHELTVLVLEPGTAVTGNRNDGYEPVNADDVVRILIEGRTKWDSDGDDEMADAGIKYRSWGGALETLTNGLEHGVIGSFRFVDEKQGSAAQPQKRRRFRLRGPKPEEAALVQRCEGLAASLSTAPEPVQQSDDYDDDPF